MNQNTKDLTISTWRSRANLIIIGVTIIVALIAAFAVINTPNNASVALTAPASAQDAGTNADDLRTPAPAVSTKPVPPAPAVSTKPVPPAPAVSTKPVPPAPTKKAAAPAPRVSTKPVAPAPTKKAAAPAPRVSTKPVAPAPAPTKTAAPAPAPTKTAAPAPAPTKTAAPAPKYPAYALPKISWVKTVAVQTNGKWQWKNYWRLSGGSYMFEYNGKVYTNETWTFVQVDLSGPWAGWTPADGCSSYGAMRFGDPNTGQSKDFVHGLDIYGAPGWLNTCPTA